mgnify:CR=1 FL=1
MTGSDPGNRLIDQQVDYCVERHIVYVAARPPRDLYKAHRAWDTLEVGGVVIGDVPSWRVDHMPYGGVKDSGLGREGVRYAMLEMLEQRILVR